MLKTIKLNLSAIRYFLKRGFLILPALLLIGCVSPILLVPMGTLLLFSFSLNAFAVEEKGDLNRLYLTLPVKRRTIVSGRYVLSVIFFLMGILFGFSLMPLGNLVSRSKWYPDWRWNLALVSLCLLFYGSMSLSMYPVLFWKGYQKGKFWGIYVPLLCFGLIWLMLVELDIYAKGKLFFHLLVYASDHLLIVSSMMILLGLALLGVSYGLSVRIYQKREF